MPKKFGCCLLTVASAFLCRAEAQGATNPAPAPGVFFVATNGNDAWSGGLSTPNEAKSDGPFLTPSRALERTREYSKAQPRPAGSATIYFREGTYFLKDSLVLNPADSGLTMAAYRGEHPVLSGGRPLTGWKGVKVRGKSLWALELPEVRSGKWFFRELWIDGHRATRARYPHQGYLRVAEVPDKTPSWTEGNKRLQFREGEVPGLAAPSDAEAVVISYWIQSRLALTNFDRAAHTLGFAKKAARQILTNAPYYLEGAFEFLSQPGDWCLERNSGMLYYIPRPGDKANQMQAIAPWLTRVIDLEGLPAAGKFITNLTFRGLTFSHSEWYFPPGYLDPTNEPAHWQLPKEDVGGLGFGSIGLRGTVCAKGLHQGLFEDCVFSHIGNYGLELTVGCEGNRVIRCLFTDLGGGGIKIGEPPIRTNVREQTRGNEVSDCEIGDGGKLFTSAVGIWVGQSPDNRIVHNHIHDMYYIGIAMGWTFGYWHSLATNNLVAYNHIHHLGRKSDGDGPIHSDMGAIYTLGPEPGTVIHDNLLHDVSALVYGGFGIYFDEGTSGVLAESNIVYRTTQGAFHQHFGETNLVRNNIFAFGRDAQVERTKAEPHLSFTMVTNIVYFDSGVVFGVYWLDNGFQVDWNDYYDTRTAGNADALHVGPMTWAQWRAHGHDLHSIVADPLFVAPKQDDFRLQPNSPALRMGFRPIDLSHVGPTASH